MTDWTRSGALAVYTWRAVAPGAGVGGNARQMRRITQEEEVTREVIGTRCERAHIARMLELHRGHRAGDPCARRALGRQRPPAGPARRGDPAVRADPVPGADRRGLRAQHVRDDRAFWAPLEDAACAPPVAAWEPAERVLTAGDGRQDRVALPRGDAAREDLVDRA